MALTIGMSSCFVLSDISNSLKEIEEVMDGKVFQIPTATLAYSEGTTFSFSEYGKKQRVAKNSEVYIFADSVYYQLDTQSKTGYKYTYSGEYAYNTTYCFLEATWKLANYDETVKKSTETIAGKRCTVYTDTDDDDKVGGWKRIVFLDGDVRAISFTTDVAENAFTVPADYQITDSTNAY